MASFWKPLKDRKAYLHGFGFRPGVKIYTFSPAYARRDDLLRKGALVTPSDPYYTDNALRAAGFEPAGIMPAEAIVVNSRPCKTPPARMNARFLG